MGEFLEDFCLSCGKRISGTDALEELDKLIQYLFEDIISPMPVGGLTSAGYIPDVILHRFPAHLSIQAVLKTKIMQELD